MNEKQVETVCCSGCDREFDPGVHDPRDLVYREDILKENGWTKYYGYWYCPYCSATSTVR